MRILCILFISALVALASAQTISQYEFESSVAARVQQISVRIRKMAEEGLLKVYRNDSMSTLESKEDVIKFGQEMIIRQIPVNPAEPDWLLDTVWFERINDSFILDDMTVTYDVVTSPDFSVTLKPRGFAPMMSVYYPTGITYHRPLYFADINELSHLLSPAETEFLRCYAWFKSFEPNVYYSNCANPEEDLAVVLTDPVNRMNFTLGRIGFSEAAGSFITSNLLSKCYGLFEKGLIPLWAEGKKTDAAIFTVKHQRKIAAMIAVDPDDPTVLKDTWYYEPPAAFDSVMFQNSGSGFKFIFSQKTFSDADGKQTGWRNYELAVADVKKYLHPAEYKMIEWLTAKN